MKRFLIILIAIAFISPSCNKTTSLAGKKTNTVYHKSTAVIHGLSPLTMGAMCYGKYSITINDSTAHSTFDTLPSNSGIDLSAATFPMNVKLNWHNTSDCGMVIIDAIEKVN